jgi:hypothetical protein
LGSGQKSICPLPPSLSAKAVGLVGLPSVSLDCLILSSLALTAVKGLVAFVRTELKVLGAMARVSAKILVGTEKRPANFSAFPAPLPAWKNCSIANRGLA